LPDFLQSLFPNSPRAAAIVYSVLTALGLLALALLWQLLAPGPRRRRGLKRAQRRLAAGAWQDALERVRKLRNWGSPSAGWRRRFDEAEIACLRVAARSALAANQFEESLDFHLRMAQLAGETEASARNLVQDAMLAEMRRLFSVTTLSDTKPLHELVARTLLVQSPCAEASFWQALCFLRGNDPDRAIVALEAARAALPMSHIDPPLYLGALLLRQGLAKESLKYLTEANRVDGNCPVVTLQLGVAMIAVGGDTQLSVRALQRALGPRGLEMWEQEPRRAWVEGFPEGRSFVRKLAAMYAFVCPLWGGDLNALKQQGNLALAQGLAKLGSAQEAAELYGKVLQNGAPSLVALRGLGLTLARLGRYDEAFKHLRLAHDMEVPQNRVTAGYLALCGAKGKPTRPEDKTRNILWALKVVTCFNAPGDAEWVSLISALFDEALAIAESKESRSKAELSITLTLDEQLYLCEHLWSVQQSDAASARAYHHLQATFPQALRPEYAWLYCQAATRYEVPTEHALELFARAFADPEPARAFFADMHWDWSEVEFAYLARAAALDPGHFPSALGPQYPVLGEDLLLARSQRQEQAGDLDAALATADILAKLAPISPRALDRLAHLHYRRGNPDQAVQLLETWFNHHPQDPLPLVRFAILLHQRGLLDQARAKLREAMALCAGPRGRHIALIGAKLALQSALTGMPVVPNGTLINGTTKKNVIPDAGMLAGAEEFLTHNPNGTPIDGESLCLLAGVRCLRGDMPGLAQLASALSQETVTDTRFHFFAALSRLAADDFAGTLESCARLLANDPVPFTNHEGGVPANPPVNWHVETAYLSGLARLGLREQGAAVQALKQVAESSTSPSAAPAQALLGAIAFLGNDYRGAAQWWQALDPKRRAAWKLGQTLAQTVFLTALEAYTHGSFQEAADKLRMAGKLGCRDRRLGTILVAALFKAGQTVIYGTA
jgi:tetratricopeptide (TPR) repeat protein